MKDLTIALGTRHGLPAELLEALAARGVDVVGGCLFPRIEGRVAHVAIPDDQVDAATDVVVAKGAAVLDVRELARKVADAGASVYIAYFGASGEIVLGTSDLDTAREALGLTT